MSKVRILFLGTPDFAVAALDRLIRDDHFEIVGVVSQPDRPSGRKMQMKPSPVKQLAIGSGLKVFTPESVNTPEFLAQIGDLGAEAAVVVAFGQILSQKFLDLFPHGAVNVHGSVLPRWRGAAPIQRALMNGDTESGVSLQIVVRKLDAGPVLGLRRVILAPEMDAQVLHDQLKVLGAELLHVDFMDYLRGNLTPQPQDESAVTIAKKIEKSEARVNWNSSATEICNQIRGLVMGPVAWCERDGRSLKLFAARAFAGRIQEAETILARPGVVVEVKADQLLIACGEGLVELLEVQPESRSRQKIAEYIRGYPIKVGDHFA